MYVSLQLFRNKDAASCIQCQDAASASRKKQRAAKKATSDDEQDGEGASSNIVEEFPNETDARIWLNEYLDNEPVPFRKPHVKSGKLVETSGSSDETKWKTIEFATLKSGSIWRTEILYCMCHGSSRAKMSATYNDEGDRNSQQKLLAEMNADGTRKRKAPRRGIWDKSTNRIGCPKIITLKVFINQNTFGSGRAQIQIHHRHLPECESHAEVRMAGALRDWVETCMDVGITNRNIVKIFDNPDSLPRVKFRPPPKPTGVRSTKTYDEILMERWEKSENFPTLAHHLTSEEIDDVVKMPFPLMNAVDERDDPTNVAQRRTKTVPLAQDTHIASYTYNCTPN